MKRNPIIDALAQAVQGLLYISESEAELTPFLWQEAGDLSEERLLKLAGAAAGTAVESEALANFFRTVSQEDKPKFDKLAKVLNEQLAQIKVYKIGDEAEKDVFIVGKTRDGQWAGVKTSAVET